MVFPQNFMEEEIREGFCIAELMKRAWAAELEVLQVVADICEKNNITWFAYWGTMLGAVRHQGFIPWDDDIDIGLVRPEYDRLIKHLRTELPEGFALTGMYAEDSRLRRATAFPHTRVMADEECWSFLPYLARFHGFPFFRIGIDIFPVDYIPRENALLEEQKHKMAELWILLEKWIYDEEYPVYKEEKSLQKIERLCDISLTRDETVVNQLWKLYDSICSSYSENDADHVATYHFLFNKPKMFYRKGCFDEITYMPFEVTELPVPSDYDEILRATYGDYKVPVQGAGAAHDYPFYSKQQEALEEIFRERGITRSIPDFCRDFMRQWEGGGEDGRKSLREKLIRLAGCFEQGRIEEGMNCLMPVVEQAVKLPETAGAVNSMLDALERQDYALAAGILRQDMAGQL